MAFTKQQIKDLKAIMSVEEEMVPFLSLFKPSNRILNPWQKEFPKVFKELGLKKGMTVVDMPCGQGGVSVPMAKKYGVEVTGYDIVPAYVRYAREYAKEKGVSGSCKFKVEDIRKVVKQKDVCDVLLWVGPPHVFGRAKPTIKKLRNLVRDGGKIVIADAYLYPGVRRKGMFLDYENFANTTKGYISFGDELVTVYDQKSSLWDLDYKRTRKEVAAGIRRAKNKKSKETVKRCLASLDSFQEEETQILGLAIWVVKVNKSSKKRG